MYDSVRLLGPSHRCSFWLLMFLFSFFFLFCDRTCVRKSKANTFDESIKPAVIYLLKVNNRNTRTRCEKYSKLTIKTPERRQWHCSGIFIVNFKHNLHPVLVFLLVTLKMSGGWEVFRLVILGRFRWFQAV